MAQPPAPKSESEYQALYSEAYTALAEALDSSASPIAQTSASEGPSVAPAEAADRPTERREPAAGPSTPSEAAGTETVAQERARPTLAVLDFDSESVSASDTAVIVDLLSTEIFQTRRFRVIDRKQRERILGELKFALSDCSDESCQLEAGKMLAAEKIIVGSLGRVGSRYVCNARMVDVETGETLSANSTNVFTSLDELLDAVRLIASELVEV